VEDVKLWLFCPFKRFTTRWLQHVERKINLVLASAQARNRRGMQKQELPGFTEGAEDEVPADSVKQLQW